MKESLFDIFQRHRDCYDNRKSPTFEELKAKPEARQLETDRFRERKQAASEYASSLIPLGNDWIEAVKIDVKILTTTLPPSMHFDKAEREAYRDGVEDFLLDVAAALREHGKGKFLNDEYLDPVTLYRLGIATGWKEPKTGLSEDEAKQMAKEMKQQYSQVYCFPDLFSMFPATYTIMGYNAKASTKPQKKADSSATGKGMDNNAATNPQTPPAAQETPQVAVMHPYTRKHVGRPTGDFVTTIKDTYKGKADIIQEHTKTALETMTDPKAVIALFIVYFQNDIIKQCPTYWQTLRLLDIIADTNRDKEKLCPFGMHQQFDKLRNIYFDSNNCYLSLNETDIEQENNISNYIQAANDTFAALLAKLIPTPQKKARKGA